MGFTIFSKYLAGGMQIGLNNSLGIFISRVRNKEVASDLKEAMEDEKTSPLVDVDSPITCCELSIENLI